MIVCPNCMAHIPDDTAFCPICGTPQTKPQQPQQPQYQPPQQTYQQPQYPQQTYQPPVNQQPAWQNPAPQQPVWQPTAPKNNSYTPPPRMPGSARALSIISLVCGIFSIILSCTYLGFVLAPVAIILKVIANSQLPYGVTNPMGGAGMTTAIIGLVLAFIFAATGAMEEASYGFFEAFDIYY